MGIFKKNKFKARYLANGNALINSSFGTLADNVCWNTLTNKDEKIYLITSTTFAEGKTTVAVNLTVNIAKRGKKVLLIDANLRNPMIGKIFNIGDAHGLMQISSNGNSSDSPHQIDYGVSIRDITYPVERSNIHLITAGKIDHEPFEVLTSPQIKDLLIKSKNFYDYVIVDCTAVTFADPLLLCPSIDQIIFVVLADKTEKDEALIAKAKLSNVEGNILGVVLNRPVA